MYVDKPRFSRKYIEKNVLVTKYIRGLIELKEIKRAHNNGFEYKDKIFLSLNDLKAHFLRPIKT